MTVTKITDHAAAAIERLHDFHRDRPLIELLVEVCATPADALEDAFYQLLTERFIDNAVGAQLDLLGKIVTEARQGRSDDDYRRFIRARISANNSEGLIEDLIRVTRAVLGTTDHAVRPEGDFPACIRLHVEGEPLDSGVADILVQFLRDAALGGVRVLLYSAPSEDADSFEFGDLPGTVDFTIANSTTGLEQLDLASRSDLPLDGGSVIIDWGGPNEQQYNYTSIVPEEGGGDFGVMYGISPPTTAVHYAESITLLDEDQGMGDATDAGVGGDLSSVLE